LPISGTTVSSQLRFGYSLAGGSYTYPVYLDSVGNINTTANLKLPTTSSTAGQIQINGNRYFHAYEDPTSNGENLFLGKNAGNFTMAKTGSNTYEASLNVGITTYTQLTTGYRNIGILGGSSLTSGNSNVQIG